MESDLAGLRQQRERKLRENEDLGRRIEALKIEQERSPNYFTKKELDNLLSRQRELSRELGSIESRISAREGDLRKARSELRALYTVELNKLAASIDAEKDRGRKAELIDQYFTLREAKSRVPVEGPEVEPLPALPGQLTIGPLDTAEDLIEKAEILRDSERRIRARMKKIESTIAELEQDRRMDQEMWETIERERFFEDGGVMRTTGQRTPPRLEEYDAKIAELRAELGRLSAIADELAGRAAEFEREANRRRGVNR